MWFVEKLAKFCLHFFSIFGSYAVKFEWVNGDCFFEKEDGFHMFIWYFKELATFSIVPILGIHLHQTWDSYIERRDLTQLMIGVFFLLVFPFCCTLQIMFHRHRDDMIALVNQTIKLGRFFESSKYFLTHY